MRIYSALIALFATVALSSTALAGSITSTDDARLAAAQFQAHAVSAQVSPVQAPIAVTSTDEARRAHEQSQAERARLAPPVKRAIAPAIVTTTDEARAAARWF